MNDSMFLRKLLLVVLAKTKFLGNKLSLYKLAPDEGARGNPTLKNDCRYYVFKTACPEVL